MIIIHTEEPRSRSEPVEIRSQKKMEGGAEKHDGGGRGGGDTFISNLKKPIQIQRENIIQGPPSRGLSK